MPQGSATTASCLAGALGGRAWRARLAGALGGAVGSAAEARPLLASTQFDAVLIDLEMPDTDGRALAAEVRQGDGLNAASMLILISAAENQATGQAWPFDGLLQKPIDGQALARLIGSPAKPQALSASV